MANKSTAAESIRRLATQYQQMVEAADMLDQIGSLENAAKEAEKATAAARAEADSAQADAAKAKADAKTAKDKVAATMADAEEKALVIAQQAEIKAQELIADGKARAQQILTKASLDAANATVGIEGKVAELSATRASIEQSLVDLQSQIDAKQVEAEELEKRLAKAQASIAKLLG